MYRNQQQEHETSIHDKMVDVANMRESYHNDKLHKQELPSDPFEAFDTWLKEAVEAGQAEPNAMTLASVDQNGYPNARMVLLKGYSEQGFSFFTNYCSAKGKELEENNHVALVFWWHACHRQVRIRGQVEKLSAEESDEYFYSRPHDSQVAACASHQSEVSCLPHALLAPHCRYLAPRITQGA